MPRYELHVGSYFSDNHQGCVKSFTAPTDEEAKQIGKKYFDERGFQCDTWVEIQKKLGWFGLGGRQFVERFKRPIPRRIHFI